MANFNYIKENYKVFSNLIYGNVDRLPVKDQEARTNFKSIVIDYINFLHDLQFLSIPSYSSLDKQVQYSKKLFILCDRLKSKSLEEVIPDDAVEGFCVKLQEHMKDWAHNDLDIELKKLEREHYTNLAFSRDTSMEEHRDRIHQLKNAIESNNYKNLG